jgi:putative flippase GtrA
MMHQQSFRYGAIRLGLNAVGYAAYLLLTRPVPGRRAAITLTCCCVLVGFVLNRRITFRFDRDDGSALSRYFAAYAIGNVINFGSLVVG